MSASDADGSWTPLVLFNRYSEDISAVAGIKLGPDGISNRDVGMLVTIRRIPGITPSELAESVGATRSFVSRRLRRFQEAGLVARRIDPTDHRRFTLAATARGVRSVDDFEAMLGDWFVESAAQATALLATLGGGPRQAATQPLPRSPLEIVTDMARAGQVYVADAVRVTLPFGVANKTDRYAIAFVSACASTRPVDLALELDLAPSGVNSLLARLEDAGIVARTAKSLVHDRRAANVRLTPRGRTVAQLMTDNLDSHAPAIAAVIAPAVTYALARRDPRPQVKIG